MQDIFQANLRRDTGDSFEFRFNDTEGFRNSLKHGYTAFDVTPHKSNQLSDVQRKKAYAMIHDIADYEGYPDDIKKVTLKEQFRAVTGYPEFSLGNCYKDIATAFISYLVEYCFYYDIPFRFKDLTNTFDTDRQVFLCLVHKRCTVCGTTEDVQINHEDAVQNGNNRNHIDHREHRIEMLCATHHIIFHTLGAESFFNKYHFHGIKPSNELVMQLKLMSKKQINEFDKEKEQSQ